VSYPKGGDKLSPPLHRDGGRYPAAHCANTEGLFRIIQSITSPKVEPLQALACQGGKERLDEIENPELAMGRMQDLYEKKGYPKEWIDKAPARYRGTARLDR